MDTHTEHRVWKTTSPYPFEAFGAGLAEYTATGKPPAQGNQDVRYALRLQKERLESRSLLMKYEFTPRGHFADASGPGREWRDDLYTSRMEYRTCRMTRSFCRTQSGSQPHRLYEKSQNYIFYQTITDANHYDSMEDEPYVCPSCGAPGRIGDLESGCPYCGTFFQMSDLFPKTTSFYFVEDVGGTQTEVKGSMKTTMRLCMAVFFLLSLFHMLTQGTFSIPMLIWQTVLSLLLGAGCGYLLYSLKLGAQLIRGTGKALPKIAHTAGSSARFVEQMRQYSPEFSYEYFSGKAVSLLRMLLFSKDAEKLSVYAGPPLNGRFDSIVDVSYSGACALQHFGVQGETCFVTVDVFLDTYTDQGSRIREKEERFRVTLCRNIRRPINLHFSIQAIKCRNCGASFDAAVQKYCPHCATPVSLAEEDWIVTAVSRI